MILAGILKVKKLKKIYHAYDHARHLTRPRLPNQALNENLSKLSYYILKRIISGEQETSSNVSIWSTAWGRRRRWWPP